MARLRSIGNSEAIGLFWQSLRPKFKPKMRMGIQPLIFSFAWTKAPCLVQSRPVADQAGLGARARQQNLAGAFRLRRPITAGAVVIVDDLVTTGSSITEAARVLREAGIPVLGAATVAATVRLRTSPWRTENSVRIPGSGRNTR